MKKFLVIFMGIFTVLAMSTVAFASNYLTFDELKAQYGLPTSSKFTEENNILYYYNDSDQAYYLIYSYNGFSARYWEDYAGVSTYEIVGNGGAYEKYLFRVSTGWDYSPTTGNYSDNITFIPFTETNQNKFAHSHVLYSSSNILISVGKTEDEVGTIFFQQPVETPENPEVPEVEIPESGEIIMATTLPEIAQEASLEKTLLEILGLIPILMAFLVSFLGLKKALKLLSQLLHQS